MKKILLSITLMTVFLTGCSSQSPVRYDKQSYAPTFPVQTPKSAPNNGSLYQAGQSMSFFNDDRARKVGDIIIVKLAEKMTAKKAASTSASTSVDTAVTGPSIGGKALGLNLGKVDLDELSLGLGSDRNFTGDGDAEQSNSLTGDIAVTVTEVLSNGNLVVRGEKWVTINQGDEVIRFSGIVRTADIDQENTISSTKVADARIIYSGTGMVHDSTKQPVGSKILSAILPF